MKQMNKILIANRGEIAIRVMRTCREMGIATVAIFSEADKDALFVLEADEALSIGGFNPSESYLDQEKVIEAVKRTKADAIHPGYGFLSENAGFAEKCREEGIIFIGPNPEAIAAMGDKKGAKEIMQRHDVPVIPGYDGADQTLENLKTQALKVGFPLLLKASAGGGGKGMRIVRSEDTLEQAIDAAKREALGAFGNDTLLIERYFEGARHIEFQIFGDRHGNAVHMFERECSIQRRYQKIIEESPSPALTAELREAMAQAAVNAAKAINYDNAGTVEFILDQKGDFYFLEVNTRLQVEHPVTEMVTGLDLVRLQIDVASGKTLPFQQDDLEASGHAIECRIYAEDPAKDFQPATGTIHYYDPYYNDFVRYDDGITSGSVISSFYDPMIAKVITFDEDRSSAIRQMKQALGKTALLGLTTNQWYLQQILDHEAFLSGDFNTGFLDTYPQLTSREIPENVTHESAIVALLYTWYEREDNRTVLKSIPSGWRNNFNEAQRTTFIIAEEALSIEYHFQNEGFTIHIGDKSYEASILLKADTQIYLEIDGLRRAYFVVEDDNNFYVYHPASGQVVLEKVARFPETEDPSAKGSYAAPMPGEIVKVLVQSGDEVKSGDGLVVINSMKMENTIEAFEDGVVEEVFVAEKSFVEADTPLVKILAAAQPES